MPTKKTSAGLLMFRLRNSVVEIFLAHPGGPHFRRKDEGHWTIPKGEIEPGEEKVAAAIREFKEETGIEAKGDLIPLGSVKQRGGKTVFGWAFAGNWDDGCPIVSNCHQLEWPPKSGRFQEFPEIDQAQFFRSSKRVPSSKRRNGRLWSGCWRPLGSARKSLRATNVEPKNRPRKHPQESGRGVRQISCDLGESGKHRDLSRS